MSLGDDILAHNEVLVTNENDLFNLLVVVITNGPAQADKRKQMSTIFNLDTTCSVHVTFTPNGFWLTAASEEKDISVEKHAGYPFWSHNLGEMLCDMEAEWEDAQA